MGDSKQGGLSNLECPNCKSFLIQYANKIGFECTGCGAKYLGIEEVSKVIPIPRYLIKKSPQGRT